MLSTSFPEHLRLSTRRPPPIQVTRLACREKSRQTTRCCALCWADALGCDARRPSINAAASQEGRIIKKSCGWKDWPI
eukprot:2436374-Pyramimonas_sp.AAC.1